MPCLSRLLFLGLALVMRIFIFMFVLGAFDRLGSYPQLYRANSDLFWLCTVPDFLIVVSDPTAHLQFSLFAILVLPILLLTIIRLPRRCLQIPMPLIHVGFSGRGCEMPCAVCTLINCSCTITALCHVVHDIVVIPLLSSTSKSTFICIFV
jgi:hypothetical protein